MMIWPHAVFLKRKTACGKFFECGGENPMSQKRNVEHPADARSRLKCQTLTRRSLVFGG